MQKIRNYIKALKKYIICTLFLVYLPNITLAIDFTLNDGCVVPSPLSTDVTNDDTNTALYSLYSSMLDMSTAEGSNCASSSDTVTFYFGTPGDDNKYSMQENDTKEFSAPPAKAKITRFDDTLCLQFITGTAGYQTYGCRYSKSTTNSDSSSDDNCYIGKSCGDAGARKSRSIAPFTSMVMQCIRDSLDRVFFDSSVCKVTSTTRPNLFPAFQDSMRGIVKTLLIIYVIFYGFKVVLGTESINKNEAFMFLIKMVLVIYFSVGFGQGVDDKGYVKYEDGISKLLKPMLEDISFSLSDTMIQAASSYGMCHYETTDYDKGYQYLAMWDSLDCRVLHYLGARVLDRISAIESILTLDLIGYALNAYLALFAILLMLFAFFLISFVFFFIHFYMYCLLGLTILIYLAPIFVPFSLFTATKGYFDGWLKLLISYALQPMVVSAFIAFMLTVFDSILYSDCQWVNKLKIFNYTLSDGTLGGRSLPVFSIDQDSASVSCKESFGYISDTLINNNNSKTLHLLFWQADLIKVSVVVKLMGALLLASYSMYLFYYFAKGLAGFSASITDGNELGKVVGSPTELFDRVIYAIKAYIKYKMGDKKGAMKDGKKALTGDKSSKGSGSTVSASGSGQGGSGSTDGSGSMVSSGSTGGSGSQVT